MPLKVDHVCSLVIFPFFVFGEGVTKRLKGSASGRVIGLSGITGRLPISIKLKNKRFITRQRDSHVIEFQHTHLVEYFKRARKLSHAIPSFKINVLVPFTLVSGPKTPDLLRFYYFIFERPILARTAYSATENAVESQKKESTSKGIFPVRSLNKCKLFCTEPSTAYRGGAFA